MKGSGKPPQTYAGPSILDQAWAMLDEVVDGIMSDKLSMPGSEEPAAVGEATGLARAIAVFTNPYNPSLEAVRAEAMRRWEERQA